MKFKVGDELRLKEDTKRVGTTLIISETDKNCYAEEYRFSRFPTIRWDKKEIEKIFELETPTNKR